MAPRANWKGVLKIDELLCPVSLFTAASTSERISFHTLNRKTGNRVQRQFFDPETQQSVSPADQVKGYDTGSGDYIVLGPEEIAAALPESDKILAIQGFIRCGDIDDIYFDRPYYLAPTTPEATEAFALLRDGMRSKSVAALARAILFRRVRTVLIRPHDQGLIATTMNFDYEVRSEKDAFSTIPHMDIKGEMLDLARHIIETKMGKFDPTTFDDRYEAALTELVQAKLEGRKITAPKAPAPTKVTDLMAALRQSAKGNTAKASRKSAGRKTKPSAERRKAS